MAKKSEASKDLKALKSASIYMTSDVQRFVLELIADIDNREAISIRRSIQKAQTTKGVDINILKEGE